MALRSSDAAMLNFDFFFFFFRREIEELSDIQNFFSYLMIFF